MRNTYVGANYGGNVGGQGNTVNNFNSFNSFPPDDLSSLISEFQFAIEHEEIPKEKKEEAKDYLSTIQDEAKKDKPNKSTIRAVFSQLKAILINDKFLTLMERLTNIINPLIK